MPEEVPLGVSVRFASSSDISMLQSVHIQVFQEDGEKEKCLGAQPLVEGSGAAAAELVVQTEIELSVVVKGYNNAGCSGDVIWRGETHGVVVSEGKAQEVNVFVTRVGEITILEDLALLRGMAFQTATRLLDGRVLLAGGILETQKDASGINTNRIYATNNAFIYYPHTATIVPVEGGLNHRRAMHSATLTPEGKVLILGGVKEMRLDTEKCEELPIKEARDTWVPYTEIFDPEDNKFHLLSYRDFSRAGHSATKIKINNEFNLLIAGGRKYPTEKEIRICPLVLTETPQCVNWDATPRFGHTATLFPAEAPSRVLLIGGNEPYSEPDVTAEFYDRESKELIEAGWEGHSPLFHTTTLLSGPDTPTFLIAGGYEKTEGEKIQGPTRYASLFELIATGDGSPGHVTEDLSMNIARAFHRATLMSNGDVLISGGITDCRSGEGTAEIEIFRYDTENDPLFMLAKNMDGEAINMTTPRFGHTVTPLEDGTFFIAGGFAKILEGESGSGEALRSIEIYHPIRKENK